jgi:hypothetical protein
MNRGVIAFVITAFSAMSSIGLSRHEGARNPPNLDGDDRAELRDSDRGERDHPAWSRRMKFGTSTELAPRSA